MEPPGHAPDRIVTQKREPPIEKVAGANASNHRCHTVAGHAVEPCLWPVELIHDDHSGVGCAGQLQIQRQAAIAAKGVNHLVDGGLVEQRHRDRLIVSIYDSHTMTMGAYLEGGRFNGAAGKRSHDLEWLCLHLAFFAIAVRHDIVDQVERGDARIARS